MKIWDINMKREFFAGKKCVRVETTFLSVVFFVSYPQGDSQVPTSFLLFCWIEAILFQKEFFTKNDQKYTSKFEKVFSQP